MRGPGADSVPAARLNEVSATAAEFGSVGYTHAGGVDRPLVVWKGATVVVPHTNWRGVFGKGTNSSGGTSTVAIEWPGFISTAYHAIMTSSTPTTNWMGSLIGGHRDPGGHMYMSNRYYDPATGQFTQTDPIGVSGGVNVYGYGGGDPVNQHDPFGLACEKKSADRMVCTNIGSGDAEAIRDFLGGESGNSAYSTLRANPAFRSENGRGGWSGSECMAVANAMAHLVVSNTQACSRMGTRATRRFQAGRYLRAPVLGEGTDGMAVGLLSPFAFGRIVLLHPRTATYSTASLANVISHEEYHMWHPLTAIPPLGNRWFHREAYSFGDTCGGS